MTPYPLPRPYQQDEEPTVIQAVGSCVVIGALGWALIWKIIRRKK